MRRSTRWLTRMRPILSGRALRKDGGPGGLPQRPLHEEARHGRRGSRAQRAEAPWGGLPDGRHRALPQARDLGRGDHRRDSILSIDRISRMCSGARSFSSSLPGDFAKAPAWKTIKRGRASVHWARTFGLTSQFLMIIALNSR